MSNLVKLAYLQCHLFESCTETVEMSGCSTCVTGLLPGVRRGRALAGDHGVRRAGHALRLVEEDPREVRALNLRTEEKYHYEEKPHTQCDRVIQRSCDSRPDNMISVLYRCSSLVNKHYMRSRPSITCKELFDLDELPWFLHFLNTP